MVLTLAGMLPRHRADIGVTVVGAALETILPLDLFSSFLYDPVAPTLFTYLRLPGILHWAGGITVVSSGALEESTILFDEKLFSF